MQERAITFGEQTPKYWDPGPCYPREPEREDIRKIRLQLDKFEVTNNMQDLFDSVEILKGKGKLGLDEPELLIMLAKFLGLDGENSMTTLPNHSLGTSIKNGLAFGMLLHIDSSFLLMA